jgi:hyperosmotically inducible periplasmic protein
MNQPGRIMISPAGARYFFELSAIANRDSRPRAGQSDTLPVKEKVMKTTFATTCVLFGTLLGPAIVLAQDSDTDRSHPTAFVKDSAITTSIKTQLAAEHITSLGRIHVDTDKDGVVWLSGSAKSQQAADKAVSIARGTEHVKSVHSDIKIKADD